MDQAVLPVFFIIVPAMLILVTQKSCLLSGFSIT